MRFAVAVVIIGGLLLSGVPGASGSSSEAYLSPPKTTIEASPPDNPNVSVNLTGENNSRNFEISCTFDFSFKTPKDGTTVTFSVPQLTSCTNQNETAATVTASGVWKARWKSQSSANLINGKNELTVSSGTVPGCVITITPKGTRPGVRLIYDQSEAQLDFLASNWVTSSPADCWSGYAGLSGKVALTPPVTYNS
jgi:hypothetical protein